MKLLKLPHKTADYLCPVNGMCDIYEWTYQSRIPEELLFYARTGFQMISNKRATPPKLVFFSSGSIGRRQYEFWKDILNYTLITKEGRSFSTTLKEIKTLIDKDIPVILFGLDMYYLSYHTNFYYKTHIPGHIILMVGYDEDSIYLHDNDKENLVSLSYKDLQDAWGQPYLTISKKHTYFAFKFNDDTSSVRDILATGFAKTAETFLHPPVRFMGIAGVKRLLKELPTWNTTYNTKELRDILLNIVEFTGSVLPEIPESIGGPYTTIDNPHRGCRDKLASALRTYASDYGNAHWLIAANHFEESGKYIESITFQIIEMIQNDDYTKLYMLIPLLESFLFFESKAQQCFLHK